MAELIIRSDNADKIKQALHDQVLNALDECGVIAAVAVDPDVIPLGSKLYIVAEDGFSWEYGYAVAEDTGSSIQGERIDLFFWSERDCQEFGRKMATVYVLAQ